MPLLIAVVVWQYDDLFISSFLMDNLVKWPNNSMFYLKSTVTDCQLLQNEAFSWKTVRCELTCLCSLTHHQGKLQIWLSHDCSVSLHPILNFS